jgi:ribose transport system substrate-binding protein
VDGLLVSPSSPTVPHDAIVDAVESGVYVICVDQFLDPMDASAFYGTNGVQACKDLAAYMVENILDGSGTYAELVYNMTSLASIDRHDGFVAGMQEFAPGMENIGYEITDSDIAQTQSIVANMIQANDDLKVLFANNDRSALGTLNALRQAASSDIAMCNVDINLELLQAMREGLVKACALQMPYNQGYEGVKMLLALMNGEEVQREGDSGSFLLTLENMDSDEAVAAIRQYIEGYEPADSQL